MAHPPSDAIRNGVAKAARLHERLGSKTAMVARLGGIDVFETISSLDIALLLRPLKGLLGVYFRKPKPGILITTQRPLSIQRFTAAHELGHYYLEHRPVLTTKMYCDGHRSKTVDCLTYRNSKPTRLQPHF